VGSRIYSADESLGRFSLRKRDVSPTLDFHNLPPIGMPGVPFLFFAALPLTVPGLAFSFILMDIWTHGESFARFPSFRPLSVVFESFLSLPPVTEDRDLFSEEFECESILPPAPLQDQLE